MTRLIHTDELPQVVDLCQPIIAASTHPGKSINREFFIECWTELIRAGHAFMVGQFEEGTGALTAVSAMVVCPDLLTGITCAQQALVGVHPSKRGMGLRSVLNLAEKEAYERGAKYISVTRANETAGGPRMDRFYEARGYRAVQTTLLNDQCLSSQQSGP